MKLGYMFDLFQDFVGKTRNFSTWIVARFSSKGDNLNTGNLDARRYLTLKICSLVNC